MSDEVGNSLLCVCGYPVYGTNDNTHNGHTHTPRSKKFPVVPVRCPPPWCVCRSSVGDSTNTPYSLGSTYVPILCGSKYRERGTPLLYILCVPVSLLGVLSRELLASVTLCIRRLFCFLFFHIYIIILCILDNKKIHRSTKKNNQHILLFFLLLCFSHI